DLMRVRHQTGVLSTIATRFLIPDNHIGRATVSSVAVAHEVAKMGCRAVACVNARDRNLLGFRRDLLTAAAYGVEEFLFVYGDRPETGRRSDDLTVRSMIQSAREFAEEQDRPVRIGEWSRSDRLDESPDTRAWVGPNRRVVSGVLAVKRKRTVARRLECVVEDARRFRRECLSTLQER
ncbi:MAG: hypothetical protein WAT55_02235, partial [Candidatus Microthrix parvicella]